jgi:hypothetical protein
MNGVRVNGHRIVEAELCPGDEVSVADVSYVFQRDDLPARSGKPGSAGADGRARIRDVRREAPEEPRAEPDDYENPDDISDIRLKDDSHSAEHGFVRV